MDGQNYLVFHTAADDSYMNSTANFKGADVTSNTEITMYFGSASAQAAFGYDSVVLTITAGKEVQVMEALAAACAGAKNPVTVIADDINSKYIHDNITACSTISVATEKARRKVVTTTPSGDGSTGSPTVTLTASDSGTTYFADISSNTCAYKLPAVAAGLFFTFILAAGSEGEATKDLIITTNDAADDIIGVGLDGAAVHATGVSNSTITFDSSAAGGDSSGVDAGDSLSVVCDGTDWYIEDAATKATAVFASS